MKEPFDFDKQLREITLKTEIELRELEIKAAKTSKALSMTVNFFCFLALAVTIFNLWTDKLDSFEYWALLILLFVVMLLNSIFMTVSRIGQHIMRRF